MKPRVVLVLLLLLGSCKTDPSAGTPSPSPAVPMPLAGDALRIQGRWLVVYNELKRHALPEMNGEAFLFRQDRFRLGSDPPGSERFVIDESHVPKRIDFDDGHSPKVLGIYQMDGDRLMICTGGPGEARPTEFATSWLSGAVLTRLERAP